MNKTGQFSAILVVLALSAFLCHTLYAMSSTNYYINWDSINIGGTDFSSSTNFYMHDTLGEMSTGRSSSTNYWIYAGYRQPEEVEDYLQFSLSAQKNSTKISYTAFSDSSKQVTLSDASGYSIGDYIAVIEDMGANQLVAIGKITNISGNLLTVDKWDGNNGSMGAPAGGDDFVYKLEGNDINLGYLSSDNVNTGVVRIEVNTSASSGYTTEFAEDGNLRYGSTEITDVSDGYITFGSEEYGVETVGATASGTGDFAIRSDAQIVQTSSAPAENDRIGIIHKISIDSSTGAGPLSHVVSFYVTANF